MNDYDLAKILGRQICQIGCEFGELSRKSRRHRNRKFTGRYAKQSYNRRVRRIIHNLIRV